MTRFDDEFRGLFFGEGCLDLQRLSRNHRSLTPRVRITLHEKDLPLLEQIQRRYGGRINPDHRNPAHTWTLTGQANVLRILDILESGELLSAKRRECSILRRAIENMPARGIRFSPGQAEYLAGLRVALASAKRSVA